MNAHRAVMSSADHYAVLLGSFAAQASREVSTLTPTLMGGRAETGYLSSQTSFAVKGLLSCHVTTWRSGNVSSAPSSFQT